MRSINSSLIVVAEPVIGIQSTIARAGAKATRAFVSTAAWSGKIARSKNSRKNMRAKMSTSICPGRPAGGHGIGGRMEDHMNNLFSAHRTSTSHRAGEQQADWSRVPPSGFGRLLAAIAIIGIAVSFLDYAAAKGPANVSVASSYGPTQEWR
ncbi:hypothetical protein RQ479_22675 [Mesorhizobium sp. ISC25]|uniref:hypothetical protein n=1 Tax=Mesorhizobium sp. ISC25 TaxID=3077335 RepID=UPI0035DF75F8